jgi:formylglycine-generating enzyme required for sulfatase activity/uncharacterized caspase-like protein
MKPRVMLLLAALAAMLSLVEPACAQRNLTIAAAPASEQRVALIIGNAAYKDAPLRNPVNDATDMARALRELGFKTTLKTNAGQRQMKDAIREFGSELARGGVGLFYFAGHGIQYKGRNFLVPIGAAIEREAHIEDETVDAAFVLAHMEDARNRVNLVILDACRNNPYTRGMRSVSRGLAQMDAAQGTLVAFATAPGAVALDGDGRNGVYTKHLLKQVRQPGVPVELMFKEVRNGVIEETREKQTPWEASSLRGANFYFRPPAGGTQVATVAPSAPANPAADERAFWESIKDSKDSEEFKAYLEQFPGGRFAGLARTRLKSLTAAARPPVQVASAPSSVQTTRPTPLEQGLQSLAAGSAFKDCDGCPEMVVVPSGSYAMGGSRRITLSRPFAVGKTEISFAQWDACVTEGGCTHRPDDGGWGRVNQPVMNVNWDDAKQFVAWLARKTGKGYRLLSESEWEYSARAGTTTQYYWGDSDSDICRYASVDNRQSKGGIGCGTNKTSPVGSRQPNAFGLYDMLGNVWEWVEDCYNAGIDGVPSDGNARTTGDCGRRVLRGGTWRNLPSDARSGNRNDFNPTFRSNTFGFRVARTL